MIILIRHSIDNEIESTYAHDAKLKNSGKRLAYKKAVQLIKKYGFPSRVYLSPFERTRSTAIYFAKAFKDINPNVKVDFRIDPKLSRYFTRRDQKDPQVRMKTLGYEPPIFEDIDDLMSRINRQVSSMDKKKYFEKGNVWCISHGLYIKKLLSSLGLESPNRVPFLEHYILEKKNGQITSK